jgi:hypothetical protein
MQIYSVSSGLIACSFWSTKEIGHGVYTIFCHELATVTESACEVLGLEERQVVQLAFGFWFPCETIVFGGEVETWGPKLPFQATGGSADMFSFRF